MSCATVEPAAAAARCASWPARSAVVDSATCDRSAPNTAGTCSIPRTQPVRSCSRTRTICLLTLPPKELHQLTQEGRVHPWTWRPCADKQRKFADTPPPNGTEASSPARLKVPATISATADGNRMSQRRTSRGYRRRRVLIHLKADNTGRCYG